MRSGFAVLLLLAATVLVVTGCVHPDEEISISPLPPAGGRVDPGLGPEARPLSSGPGYKGSPSWSPQGDRIAFTIDGYVADKAVNAGDVRRWTTKDFVAEDAEWTSEGSLAILGAAPETLSGAGSPVGTSRSVYQAHPGEGSPGVKEVVTEVLAMSLAPKGEGLIVALGIGSHKNALALIRGSGGIDRIYASVIEGRVTGISLSPDERRAVLAVRTYGDSASFELHTFDLRAGTRQRITRLEEDLEILGTPQWTKQGICYVAGEEGAMSGDGSAAPLYYLYQVPPDSGAPQPAPGVGEDFVASSIQVSPDGERLAVIGRLNPKSPINLYVLDLAAEALEAVTTNEDMEIKTGPDDLAWSPGGESVAIVARGTLSEEPRVHAAPKGALLEDFYNLYEIPVEDQGETVR
jgi:Tol biopolymer transport system component